MQKLLLASTSPYRKALLERLGLPFDCVAPAVAEATIKANAAPGTTPLELAQQLARAKAQAGAAKAQAGAAAAAASETLVIGSDQIATIDGRVLDKPGTVARAIEQLLALQGREHELVTAVAIAGGERTIEFVDVTRLCMRPLERAEIERYVAADSPLDCAGSYKIEGLGISLFAGIDCEDQTAIVGLPLLRLAAELRQLGFRVP